MLLLSRKRITKIISQYCDNYKEKEKVRSYANGRRNCRGAFHMLPPSAHEQNKIWCANYTLETYDIVGTGDRSYRFAEKLIFLCRGAACCSRCKRKDLSNTICPYPVSVTLEIISRYGSAGAASGSPTINFHNFLLTYYIAFTLRFQADDQWSPLHCTEDLHSTNL